MPSDIAFLPGDGIGQEVLTEARKVIEWIDENDSDLDIRLREFSVGGQSIDEHDTPLRDTTLNQVQNSDAILLGAVGGPKWDDVPVEKRPEKALLTLREECGLFANLRPVKVYESLISGSPLKNNLAERTDLLIVRELTGGIYFSEPRGIEGEGKKQRGFNTLQYDYEEIEKIAGVAVNAARKRSSEVTSVDKANVLESSRVWRDTVNEVIPEDISLQHLYVDNAAMQLIRDPGQFDVLVTGNLFGDILSDAAAQLPGSIGLLPSASLRDDDFGMYEPVHGSAPDIAGDGKANPIATLLSVAMMFRYSLDRADWSDRIESAVNSVLDDGFRTADIAEDGETIATTTEVGDAVLENLICLN